MLVYNKGKARFPITLCHIQYQLNSYYAMKAMSDIFQGQPH